MTTDTTYMVGNSVQLRSGGPLLTVTYVDSYGACTVLYYNAVTGLFEKFVVDERCLRYGSSLPETPENVHRLRGTSVIKSSLSE